MTTRPAPQAVAWSEARSSEPVQNLAVEAWRGVAAWMVVYTHFWAFSGTDWAPLRLSHTGVNLFFVVSGFVFAPYLFGRALSWRAHAVRRTMRLYPAYLVALAVYAGMKSHQGEPLHYLWQHLTFLHVQSKAMAFYYNPPFWSLPAEVEFYLVLPLLAATAAAVARRLGATGPATWLGLLLVACAALRWALGRAADPTAENTAFILVHHLPGLAVEFLLGAWAWRVSTYPLSFLMRLGLAFTGLVGWWTLARWYGEVGDAGVAESAARGLTGLLAAACFATLVAATSGSGAAYAERASERLPTRGHRWRMQGLRWAGRLSYGIYLFHMAALRLAEAAGSAWGWEPQAMRWAAVVLTLAMAWLVHVTVEEPLRRAGRRWAARAD